MKELIFQVDFKSDIVLPATSNTEGNITQLDFIPGSNFLGMAAFEYDEYKDSFDVFHSGAVRFGDATILKNAKQTYKMPLSFFHEKLNDTKIYNHHHIEDFSECQQLKQLRNGYVTSAKKLAAVEYNYSQKSAYDKDNRRSKDKHMFGYNAIKSGSKWQFTLKCDDKICSDDIERIKRNLLGTKRLGKSKSAQYGEVEVSLNGENENVENLTLTKEVVLYVNSRLALVNTDGNATYDLKYLCEGLMDKNILYAKTQLKTSTFTPYNGVRQTKDYERSCINKGSVIVLQDITQTQLDTLKNGVGAYLSEGFGELLVNPSFLNAKEFNAKEMQEEESKENSEVCTPKDNLSLFLQARQNTKQTKLDLANEVQEFIANNKPLYNQNMNSQWGTIRSLCANTQNIYTDVEEYISHGVAKDKWDGSKATTLLNAIKKSKNPLEFTKLLSMQMPKVKNIDEEKKDGN